MAYSVSWDEARPASSDPANLLWENINDTLICVRERIDDVFGTEALPVSIRTADPYRPIKIKMSGTAAVKIVPGVIGLVLTDSDGISANFAWGGNGSINMGGKFNNRLPTVQPATGVVNVDWDNNNNQIFSLTGNTTFTFSNPKDGAFYLLEVQQNIVGGKTVTLPADCRFSNINEVIGAHDVSLTANSLTIFGFYYDGTLGKYLSWIVGRYIPDTNFTISRIDDTVISNGRKITPVLVTDFGGYNTANLVVDYFDGTNWIVLGTNGTVLIQYELAALHVDTMIPQGGTFPVRCTLTLNGSGGLVTATLTKDVTYPSPDITFTTSTYTTPNPLAVNISPASIEVLPQLNTVNIIPGTEVGTLVITNNGVAVITSEDKTIAEMEAGVSIVIPVVGGGFIFPTAQYTIVYNGITYQSDITSAFCNVPP